MSAGQDTPDSAHGLTEAEVQERVAKGKTNAAASALATRSVSEILYANAFNSVNVVLLALGTALTAMDRTRDGVINLGFIVAIVAIGSFQEIRAKRRLDHITILSTPAVAVRRGGRDHHINPAEVVLDDILVIGPGDQITVDSILIEGGPVTVDESLLTGESEPNTKRLGDELCSGTFCTSGAALARVIRVGPASLATSLTATAQEFTVTKTPLQRLVDDVLRVLIVTAVFFGLLFVAQGIVSETSAVRVVETATVTAAIIPVGLFLIFVVTYSMSAARLTRHDLLVQQLNALESLSHVNVLCTDKTGTLTANRIRLADIKPLGDGNHLDELSALLGAFAHSTTATNATNDALRAAFPRQALALADEIPFTSANRWSAASFEGASYVLGAPEALQPHLATGIEGRDTIDRWTAAGHRVLLFTANRDTDVLHDRDGNPALPPLTPLALLSFADELREGARDTIAGLLGEGVTLKVISGDNPDTVAALARQVGMHKDINVISGPELDELSEAEFASVAQRADVFGRIAPHQKDRIVAALQKSGDYVAMIGDGVNDTLALKTADVGIAMESGSSAARGIADLVLLNDSFTAVRPAIEEGRRIISGMRDILRLTVARSATLALVAVAMMIINQVFPFSAGAQTIYGLITITIPTVGLALWARPTRATDVDAAELARFVVPVALTNLLFGAAVFVATYYTTRHGFRFFDGQFDSIVGFTLGADQQSAPEVAAILGRTSLVVFLILTGLITILFLQPPLRFFTTPHQPLHPDRWAAWMVLASIALLAVIMATGLRSWLQLAEIPGWGYAALTAAVAAWTFTLRAVLRQKIPLLNRLTQPPTA
ncbi:HAD-IC family P-type ATPase [Candidatus Poriferisocius sp.]|uniref:HAD-IC family P-type ATPase n=1 Tax=Candidatus Poriferisocius sp. TaxID=3101276 RepID=UPI003B02B3A9